MNESKKKKLIDSVKQELADSIRIKESLISDEDILGQLVELSAKCSKSLSSGNKIIFAGNGGSFADAQHLSAELISKLSRKRGPLASVVLGANSSALTAIANDYGYNHSFSRELEGIVRVGDVFIPISTSGNSPNIVEAARYAAKSGIYCTAFTGAAESLLSETCKCIRVSSKVTTRVQESHITLGHILVRLIESQILKNG